MDEDSWKELRCNALWCLVTTFRFLQDPHRAAALLAPDALSDTLNAVEALFNQIGEIVATSCDEAEALRVATPMLTQGVLYLLTASAIKETPPTLPSYLASLTSPEEKSEQTHLVLLRWLHNSFVLIVPDSSALRDMARNLRATSPLNVETHNVLIRAMCQHHCSSLVSMEDAQRHFELLGTDSVGPMYTVEDMVLSWIRGVLNCHEHYAGLAGTLCDLYVDCSDGKVISMLLFAYYPDLMMEQQVAFQSNLTTEQRIQNWYAIITTLHKVGIGVTFTAYDVVYFGFQKLQLHFLSAMVELLSNVIDNTQFNQNQGSGPARPLRESIPESIAESLDTLRSMDKHLHFLAPITEELEVPPLMNTAILSPMQGLLQRTVDEEVQIASPSADQHSPLDHPQFMLVGTRAIVHTTIQQSIVEPSLDSDRTFIPIEADPAVEVRRVNTAEITSRVPNPAFPPPEPRPLDDGRSSTRSSLLRSVQHDEDLQPIMARVTSRPPSSLKSQSTTQIVLPQQPPEPIGENLSALLGAFNSGAPSTNIKLLVEAIRGPVTKSEAEAPSPPPPIPAVPVVSPLRLPTPPAVDNSVEVPVLEQPTPVLLSGERDLAQSVAVGKKRRTMVVQGSIDTDGINRLMSSLKRMDPTAPADTLSAEEALKKLQRENFALKAALLSYQHAAAVKPKLTPVKAAAPPKAETVSTPPPPPPPPEPVVVPSPPVSLPPTAPQVEEMPKALQAVQRRDSQRKADMRSNTPQKDGTLPPIGIRTNINLLRNAIRYVCLPGEVNKAQLTTTMSILDGVAESEPNAYFMVLVKADSLLFKAVYYTTGGPLRRCYGTGPTEIDLTTATGIVTFKYNTSAKRFVPLAQNTALNSLIADAFALLHSKPK